MLVDFSRQRVNVDDPFVPGEVPETRSKFHEVVPDGDDEIGISKAAHLVITVLQADGQPGERVPVPHHALAHEGVGSRYADRFGKSPQFVRRSSAHHTVAGEDHGPLRTLD